MEREEVDSGASAEGEGDSLGAAKRDALSALEPQFPGVEPDDVSFEVLEEGDAEEGRPARVRATVEDEDDWETDEDLPDSPAERVRAVVEHVAREFGVEGGVRLEEDDEEIRASVDGDDLGLMIGKHGTTIDALQHLVSRIAFRGAADRKAVVIDAAGYRERREAALHRAADQAVSDAKSFGRAVELEPMSASERRIVHTYLRDRNDVQTHSEGDEPERRLVVSPVRSS